jgi:hypothetical protein
VLKLKNKIDVNSLCIFSLVVILVLSLLTIRYYINSYNTSQTTIARIEKEASSGKEKEITQNKEIDDLRNQLSELQAAEALLPKSNDILIRDIRRAGFTGEIKDIIDDLRKHTELLPDKAILGGTMRFAEIRVISDRWVLAGIDDGHIDGYMFLNYKWNGSSLTWKVIDSYIIGE